MQDARTRDIRVPWHSPADYSESAKRQTLARCLKHCGFCRPRMKNGRRSSAKDQAKTGGARGCAPDQANSGWEDWEKRRGCKRRPLTAGSAGAIDGAGSRTSACTTQYGQCAAWASFLGAADSCTFASGIHFDPFAEQISVNAASAAFMETSACEIDGANAAISTERQAIHANRNLVRRCIFMGEILSCAPLTELALHKPSALGISH